MKENEKIFLLPKHKNQLTILYYKTIDTLKHIVYNIHITWFECDVKFDFGRIMAFVWLQRSDFSLYGRNPAFFSFKAT